MGQQQSAKQELAQVRRRASDIGIQVSGRYHILPRRIEDDYILEKQELGTGHNGSVYLGKSKASGEKVAVKPFKLFRISKAQKRELRNEVEVTLSMDHPHVARLKDVYESEEVLQLVTECLEGGELFDRIIKLQKFNESDAREATFQILLAVNYLHSKGIVHRDIKLENFLYDSKECTHLKLIDFGFSRFAHNKKMKLGCGTLAYMAPEVLSESYGMKCDVWSVGVVVFILLMGYMPFSGSNEEIQSKILAGEYKLKQTLWLRLSEKSRSFVSSLLQRDPEKRPSAEQALDMPWMREKGESSGQEGVVVDEAVVRSLRDFAKASRFRRACMSMMAWTLTNAERAEVRALFIEMDKDRTGTLTLFELKTALEKHINVSGEEVKQIFDALDSNNNDEEVNYSDFLAAMMASRIALHDDRLHQTFKRFDIDDTGYISVGNLRSVLGGCLTTQQVEEIMDEADLSKDGRISWEEFSWYMHGNEVTESQQEAMEKVIDQALSGRGRSKASGGQLEVPSDAPARSPASNRSFLTLSSTRSKLCAVM